MSTANLTVPLDRTAGLVLARTGEVCLAAGMARCWPCSALMRETVIDGECGYWCLDAHFLTRASVDDAVWAYYVRHAGQPILNTIVDAAQRRQHVQDAFSAIVLDPEHHVHRARRLIKAAYPRLSY